MSVIEESWFTIVGFPDNPMADPQLMVKILVVDENPGDVDLAREALAGQFDVRSAACIKDAEECFEHVEPALVLLGLPPLDSDALDTLVRMRRTARDVPVVVLTGTRHDELALKTLAQGATDCIAKGWRDPAVVHQAVRNTIERTKQQNKAARDLRQQKDLLEAVIGGMSEAVVVADEKGAFLLWNEAAKGIIPLGPTDVPPEQWSETYGSFFPDQKTLIPSGDLPLPRAIRGETPPDVEIFVRNPTVPTGKHLLVSARPLQDPHGNPAGGICMFRDISERKVSETLLRESEARYRSIFDSAIDMIHVVDDQHRITDANATELRKLGYSRSELIGKALEEIIAPEASASTAARISLVRSGRAIGSYETILVAKTGTRIPVVANVVPYMVAGRFLGAHAILHDMTEHNQAMRALRTSREALRNLATRLQAVREKERSAIAREIHDDLGQTLAGLKMDLSWIQPRIPKTRQLSARVGAMISQVDGAVLTVRNLSWRLRPAILDDLGLGPAIEWQVEEFARRNKVEWEVHLPAETPFLDPDATTAAFRIAQEAMANVVRHAHASHVTVRVSVITGGEALIFEVENDGRGITEADVASNESLGLIGMRERAEVLGGRFEVRPVIPRGTVASLTLPLDGENGGAKLDHRAAV